MEHSCCWCTTTCVFFNYNSGIFSGFVFVSREPFFLFILTTKSPAAPSPDLFPSFCFSPRNVPFPMITQHVIRLAHVPPPRPLNANDKVDNARSTCVLLSGGHGGLVRCSTVPAHVPVVRTAFPSPAGRSKVEAKVATKSGKASPKTAAAVATIKKVPPAEAGGKAAAADATGSAAPEESGRTSKAVPPSWEKALSASTAGVASTAAGAGAGVPAGRAANARAGGSAAAKRGRTARSKAKPRAVDDGVAGKRTRSSR